MWACSLSPWQPGHWWCSGGTDDRRGAALCGWYVGQLPPLPAPSSSPILLPSGRSLELSPWPDLHGDTVSFSGRSCEHLALVQWMGKVISPGKDVRFLLASLLSQEVVIGLSSALRSLFVNNNKACGGHMVVMCRPHGCHV